LIKRKIIPEWDEEIVKLLMVGMLKLNCEVCQVPVLEYSEYNLNAFKTAVVNFRNECPVISKFKSSTVCVDYERHSFNYVKNFVRDVQWITNQFVEVCTDD